MERRHVILGSAAVAAAGTLIAHSRATAAPGTVDEEFLGLLTARSDAQVPVALDNYRAALVTTSPRTIARRMRRIVTPYVWPRSAHHHSAALVTPMLDMVAYLEEQQHPDGTYDIGNLHSPPDTAFALQDLCLMWSILTDDNAGATRGVRLGLQRIIRKATTALSTGGVHTPNHRWEVSAALARSHRLFPHPRVIGRIEEWLAEGIDIDADGMYSERSSTYASEVTNPSLLAIAWAVDRPELRDHVRANLSATLLLLEPNGEVETVHSRRQDQKSVRDLWWYLLQYRELALLDGNGRYATAVAGILDRGVGELGDFLADVVERPELAAVLPEAAPLDVEFTEHLTGSALVRQRHEDQTLSVFGGTDYLDIPVIASGLSTNPTFVKFRSGAAILDSVRLSPRFFSTGHFRSDGLTIRGDGACLLSSEVEVPYHLPLPAKYRRADGAYQLTNEGRFWASMDFPHRPKQYRRLRTDILVQPRQDGADVQIALAESETSWTLELCFRPGGTLTGTVPLATAGEHQLVEGTGRYQVGSDVIEFGPGTGSGPYQPVSMDPGERYTYLNGNITPDGVRVYLTGTAPTKFTLQLRGSTA